MRRSGRRALAHVCHVGRWDEIDALVDAAYAEFGRIDVLVNNAGLAPTYPNPQGVTEELWDKTLAVNLKGPFRLTSLVGARMCEGDGGSIVNISSIGGVRPTHDILPYAAAKAGLNALTVGFADAFGPKVRVNAIMPGPFRTDISRTGTTRRSTSARRRSRCAARASRTRSRRPSSTSRATRRASRPARCSRSTAARSGASPAAATKLAATEASTTASATGPEPHRVLPLFSSLHLLSFIPLPTLL